MRSKFTFILLALNLGVFGYLLYSERPWSATQRMDENRRRVLGPEAANLSALEISASTDLTTASATTTPTQSVRLERRGEAWFLSTPLDWPANDFAVRRILNELQFLENETSFPVADLARNGQSLADYGLDNPRLTVTCTPAATDSAATPFVLKIGATPAVGNRLYILSPDGTRVHVVGQSLAAALSLDLAQLRSDQLFTIPVFEARALTLQAGTATTARTRLRRDQTRWLFEAPITTRAAKTPVELLVNDLNALRVSRFLAPEQAPSPEVTGLATPRARITLEGNARRESLTLGLPVTPPAPGDETVELFARLDWRTTPAANEPPVLFTVTLPVPVLETLEKAQTALRDPRLLELDPARVTAISLSAPLLPELRIQKLDSAAAWQIAAPASAVPLRADPLLVERLLQRLQLLEAVRFASDAPSRLELENLGFNRPERTIILQLAPDAPAANAPATIPSTLTLELAQPGGSDEGLYARITGQPFIYAIPPDTLGQIPVAARVYRDRALSRIPEAVKITRLTLRRAGDPAATPLLDYLADSTAPAAPVATLLAAIRDLRAKNIVREDYPATVLVDGTEQPWSYTLEATLDPASAAGPFTLSIAERTGGMTQLVGSSALGLVFTVEQPVLDALWALIYGPRDVPAP